MTSADWATASAFASPIIMLIVGAVVYWWKASTDAHTAAQTAALKAAEEDRAIARREAEENRALALFIAEQARADARAAMLRGDRVVGKVAEITATIEAKAAETKETLAQIVVVQAQIGEVTAGTHALLNSGKMIQLTKEAKDARDKANKSLLKEDFDAAELIEAALASHKAIQKIADEQGGQPQAIGAASIKASAVSLATPSETTPRATEGTAPSKETTP